MNKIKILRCQSRICVGGPAYHTIFLSSRLDNDRYETILVGGKNNPDEKSMLPLADELGVNYKIIKQMGREISFFDDLVSLFKLYKLIKKEKPYIVHTHTAKAGTIGRIAAWLAGVPKIYHTFHGHVFDGYFSKRVTKFYISIERFLSKISTKIVVISDTQNFDIVNKYKIAPQDKVVKIPLGFNWNNFLKPSYYKLRERFNIPKDKFLIAIIGRIVPIKNHKLFMEIAFKLLEIDTGKYHFIIIGDGGLKSDLLETVNRKNYLDNFTFSSWLELNKDIYSEIDLQLLTSLNEGTPVTIIESLIAGTPVIASNVGGVKDLMEMWNPKMMIKNHCINDFVDKVIFCVNENVEVNENTRKNVLEKFSVSRLIKDVELLYNRS